MEETTLNVGSGNVKTDVPQCFQEWFLARLLLARRKRPPSRRGPMRDARTTLNFLPLAFSIRFNHNSISFRDSLRLSLSLNSAGTMEGLEDDDSGEVLSNDFSGQKLSSLDRLKSLDSFDNNDTQLEEARALCNNAHRADMLARWLLAKLRTDASMRTDPQAWLLLIDCLRLLTPARIAILLGQFGLIPLITLSLTTASGHVPDGLLVSLRQSFELFLAISESPNGAPIRQIVRVTSDQAGAFFSAWTSALLSALDSADLTVVAVYEERYLEPIIHVWTMRQPSLIDDSVFVEHCCYPAVLLIERHRRAGTETVSKKRPRSAITGRAVEPNDYAQQLERLIVKHVFLDSRTSLLKQGNASGKYDAHSPQDLSTPSITSHTYTLAERMKTTSRHSTSAFRVIPILLELAIHCVPINTQRQRSKELPWVDAAFKALLNECWVACSGPEHSPETVLKMLDVVKKRSSLPSQTLQDLVLIHGGLSTKTRKKRIDWALVAKVAELNSHIYLEESLADRLFTALSKECTENHDLAGDAARRSLLKDSIARPVMEAYAQNRRLLDFVSHWEDQLRLEMYKDRWSVWLELVVPFGDLLEIHLTADKIEHEIKSRHKLLEEMTISNSQDSAEDQSTALRPIIVVLNALVQGVKSDDLQDRLQPTMEGLLNDLDHLAKCQSSSGDGPALPGIWHLATTVFSLWFPLWASQQQRTEVVAVKARALLSGPMIEVAFSIAQHHDSTSGWIPESSRPAQEAVLFVSRLCEALYAYNDCTDLAIHHIHGLVRKAGDHCVSAILTYPALLPLVDPQDREEVLRQVYAGISSADGSLRANAHAALEALTDTAVSTDAAFAADLMQKSLNFLTGNSGQTSTDAENLAALKVLLRFPTMTMNRQQREEVLNVLSNRDFFTGAQQTNALLGQRYSLMSSLMEAPNMTADLMTNPEVVWRLHPALDATASIAASLPATVDSVREVVRLMMHHLLASQNQKRSQEILKALRESASTNIKENSSNDVATSTVTRAIAAKVLQQLDAGVKDDLRTSLLGTTGHEIMRALKKLAKALETAEEQASGHAGTQTDDTNTRISVLLEAKLALYQMAARAGQRNGGDGVKLESNPTIKMSFESVDRLAHERLKGEQLVRSVDPAVQAFRLLCADPDTAPVDVAKLALQRLEAEVTPKEYVLLISTYTQYIKGLEGSEKITILDAVQPNEPSDASAASLLLLQTALPLISKTDFESAASPRVSSLPFTLLEILRRRPVYSISRAAVPCLLTMLRETPFLISQHTVEVTLTTVLILAAPSASEPLVFPNLCAILTVLLTHHRARLNGRFHILLPVLQALLSRLLAPAGRPSRDSSKMPAARPAAAFSRVLTLLCDPPTPRRIARQKHSHPAQEELVDRTRRTRAVVGSFVAPLLHSYCVLVLRSPPRDGVGEALRPGLWAVLGAMEANDRESVRVLGACMGDSERAVLRGVVEQWRQFGGKWSGI